VPVQTRPIYAGRAGGPTGQNLRPDPDPPSGRASPTHIISCRALVSYFRAVLVLARKARPIFPATPINEQRYPARRPPGHVSRRLVVVVGRAKLNCSWQILSLDNT
jgi:hypothetical protein